jgi:hypothetical protein
MSKANQGIMVDIETLSTRPNAVIVSIGACKYDLDTLKTFDDFYVTIDPMDSKKYGLHIDPETVEWWKTQDKEIMKSWRDNGIELDDAMVQFLDWYDSDLAFTCWGLNFDEPIIVSNLIALHRKPTWKYYKSRCARTMCEMEGVKINRSKGHHNALADAKDQCKAIFEIFTEK